MQPIGSLLLTPVAAVWGALARVRRGLYGRDLLATTRLDCPVVSVGNLTLGGTGKTPIVAAIARFNAQQGRQVAILSRGYRRTSRGRIVVADCNGVRSDLAAAGDEALELARSLPGVSVVVAEDRAAAAAWVERELRPDVIVLDDGFQHLRLARDRDLVVIDATVDYRRERVLPAGRLRESLTTLRLADAILITRSHLPHDQVGLRSLLRKYNADAPILAVGRRFTRLVNQRGEEAEPASLAGQRVVVLSAIGNPGQFEADVAGLGAIVQSTLRYRDHHPFTQREVERIARVARRNQAMVVTTAKDMVRLEAVADHAVDLWALHIEALIRDWSELQPRVLPPGERTGIRP